MTAEPVRNHCGSVVWTRSVLDSAPRLTLNVANNADLKATDSAMWNKSLPRATRGTRRTTALSVCNKVSLKTIRMHVRQAILPESNTKGIVRAIAVRLCIQNGGSRRRPSKGKGHC